ncbi:endonuclease III [Spirochaeta africana]|uniref:Endonuclease III n=1 Tax=Spirochaeta africana (strain ATCC 700263 / DSM 8902 / Z-7692) TaxID=889378 RepID=H9UIS2_SPIAZ|nr:endonuclease III [Spirochaeta africana]AFG37415.1 endonuclease III [Spirochaeta africana DSM 8902]
MSDRTEAEVQRLRAVLAVLAREFPDTTPPLDYASPFQLMAAVLMSAQTTDRQVNVVSPQLFAAWPDAAAMATADPEAVAEVIRSIGFFRTKARNLVAAARMIRDEFNGQMPDRMEDLVRLPGIGRKSAGVVLAHVYNTPAIIVDTHFGRVTRRLGFTTETDPVKLEHDLAAWWPHDTWNPASMRMNFHGRRWCTARSPKCSECPLQQYCPYPAGSAVGTGAT